jgi:3-deoxy-D-manno-octulosonic-acid transferase
MKTPFSLAAYRLATRVLEPLAVQALRKRARRGKEDPARLGERLGHAGQLRPRGRLVWLHGASVGESLSLIPLINRLQAARPGLQVLVTSGTVASAELLARRLPTGVTHQFIPADTAGAVERFLEHWRPDLGVLVESELWPNLIGLAHERGVKLALLSARLSPKSLAAWAKFPGAAGHVAGAFDLVMSQDDATAAGLQRLGARDDGRLNLKLAAPPLPVDLDLLARERLAFDGRPLLLAASTHPDEDELVVDAFAPLAARPDRPLLVIAPRHPVRGEEVARLASSRGFKTARRSVGEAVAKDVQVYVADTLGELGLWFSLARVALVAGSLKSGIGGHNPLEPAALGCPALSGPHVENWIGVYDDFATADAVRCVGDARELSAAFAEALDAPAALRAMADRAKVLAGRGSAAADAAAVRLLELLPA